MQDFVDGVIESIADLNAIFLSRGFEVTVTNPVTALQLSDGSLSHAFSTGDLVSADIMNSAFANSDLTDALSQMDIIYSNVSSNL